MTLQSHLLIDSQQRALAAAGALVGRPRLHAGLALLTLACGPLPDEGGEGLSTGASTLAPTTTAGSSTGGDAPTTSSTGGDALTTSSTGDAGGSTLLTDAGTTFATGDGGESTAGSTGDAGEGSSSDTGDSSSSSDTGDSSTGDGLDDCIDPRTQEVDFVCCEAQNWRPQPQCTPWGPPAPPSAIGRLQRARAARRTLA